MADTLTKITIVFKPGGPNAERAIYQISTEELNDLAKSFLKQESNTYTVQTEAGESRMLMINPLDVLYIG